MIYIESETLELKRELNKDIKKEVVAFANSKGGTILIGIDDDGSIVGLYDVNKACEQLSSILNDSIRPSITTISSIGINKIDGKSIIKLEINRGTNRPYYIAEKGLKSSGVFIRFGNTSIPATETIIRQMIVETDGTKYEDIRSFNQDLSFNFASTIFKQQNLQLGKSQQRSLGLINSDGLYTNLGLLLSDQCEHTLKVALFEGNDKLIFKDRREFEGSILQQLTHAYEYILLHNNANSTYSGLSRIDNFDYSDQVIREALINSIVHRDYSLSGSILVNIYCNRIEFTSIGGLVAGLSLDDILLGISQPRNGKLANVFYRLKLVEAYGTGIQKIQADYLNIIIKPVFNVTQGAFQLVIPNKNTNNELIKQKSDPLYDTMDNNILEFIKVAKVVSRRDIQDEFNLKQTKSGMLLRSLEKRNLIQRIGSGKNTVYKTR